MERRKIILTALVMGVVLTGCANGDAKFTDAEQKNYKNGMTAEVAKNLPPPPKPPSGPLKGYSGGSAADKALGR